MTNIISQEEFVQKMQRQGPHDADALSKLLQALPALPDSLRETPYYGTYTTYHAACEKLISNEFHACTSNPTYENSSTLYIHALTYSNFLNGMNGTAMNAQAAVNRFRHGGLQDPAFQPSVEKALQDYAVKFTAGAQRSPATAAALSNLRAEVDPPFWTTWRKFIYDEDKGGVQLGGIAGGGLMAMLAEHWLPLDEGILKWGAVALVGLGGAWAGKAIQEYLMPPDASKNPTLVAAAAPVRAPGEAVTKAQNKELSEAVLTKAREEKPNLPKYTDTQAIDAPNVVRASTTTGPQPSVQVS